MSRRGPRSAWGVAGWCTRAGGVAEAGEIYHLGRESGFAEGLAVGVRLAQRIAAGDRELAEQLRRLADDGLAGC